MAKTIYTGVSNVARKVGQPYIGVSNVAKKVKRGYIGVSGLARNFFQGTTTTTFTAQPSAIISSTFKAENIISGQISAYGFWNNSTTQSLCWTLSFSLKDSSKDEFEERFDYSFSSSSWRMTFTSNYYYPTSYSNEGLTIGTMYEGGDSNARNYYRVVIGSKNVTLISNTLGTGGIYAQTGTYSIDLAPKAVVTLTYIQ